MKQRNFYYYLLLVLIVLVGLSTTTYADWLRDVREKAIEENIPMGKVEIKIPHGKFTFSNGKTMEYTVGIGSGLFRYPKDPVNVFYGVTDRGVNIDCEDDVRLIGLDLCKTGKIFPFPSFTPTIYKITVHTNGTWKADPIPLKDQNNKPITGISNPLPTTENCYDGLGNPIPFDPNGLDVEGIVRLSDGSFYLGEEYAPSIIHVASDGRILKRIVPVGLKTHLSKATYPIVEGLPAIIAKRQFNRGIESMAITPDESTLYFALQSPLANPDAAAYRSSRLVRLLRYDLKKEAVTGEFVYEMELPDVYAKDKSTRQSDVKVSELMAVSNDRLIVLERITKSTRFYEIKIDEGKNILGSRYDDPNLADSLEKVGIERRFILDKKLMFNSDWAGDAESKIEGFTILLDNILVMINDNDFGIEGDTTKIHFIRLDKLFTANLFHINDHHSNLEPKVATLTFDKVSTSVQLGGFAKLSTLLKQYRSKYPNNMFLHAGDAFQGTLYFIQTEGKADLDLMNHIGFDAMAVGNHEFDKGDKVLADFISGAKFPVISANIKIPTTNVLSGKIKPYVIKEIGGHKIGIIGLTTPDTPNISSPGKDLVFEDAVTATNRVASELTSMGVDKIVVLSHLGYDADVALAKRVQNVDAIIGGHSHTLMGNFSVVGLTATADYPQEVSSPTGKVCVAQAWQWAHVLGRLEITWNDKGIVTNCGGMPTLIMGDWFQQNNRDVTPEVRASILKTVANNSNLEIVADDPATLAILSPYQKQVIAFRNTVVGVATADLLHIRVPGRHASGVNLPNGSLIAPHVADSFYWKAAKHNIKPDVVITNAGGIRIDIPAGNITVEKVYELLPFGNTLVPIDMTGAQIKQVLEDAMINIFENKGSTGAFPYVWRLRYTGNKNKPGGSYISDLQVQDATGAWRPIDMNKTYRVITNSFLATGRDGYVTFGKLPKGYDTGFDYAEAFMEYVKEKGKLDRPSETGVTWIE